MLRRHVSRLSLGEEWTQTSRSEADLASLLEKGGRPIGDIAFADKANPFCSVSSIRLGGLALSEFHGSAVTVKKLVDPQFSFVVNYAPASLEEKMRTVTLPPSRHIALLTYSHLSVFQAEKLDLVTIRPSIAGLKDAVSQISPELADLVDRRLTGYTTVHTGRFGDVNYHDQLLNLLTVIRNARGDRELLERIGIADVLTKLLAELLVAEAGHATAETPRAKLPESTRAVDIICDHIQHNVGTPLTIPRMEKLTGLTGRALNYAFQSRFGCSPQQWQRNFLLGEARSRLLDSAQAQSIKTIAFDLGFSSPSTFTSFYRRRYGELPSDTVSRAGSAEKHSSSAKVKQ